MIIISMNIYWWHVHHMSLYFNIIKPSDPHISTYSMGKCRSSRPYSNHPTHPSSPAKCQEPSVSGIFYPNLHLKGPIKCRQHSSILLIQVDTIPFSKVFYFLKVVQASSNILVGEKGWSLHSQADINWASSALRPNLSCESERFKTYYSFWNNEASLISVRSTG